MITARYSIDDVNVITAVSDEWERFAVENGARALESRCRGPLALEFRL